MCKDAAVYSLLTRIAIPTAEAGKAPEQRYSESTAGQGPR
jgi:hypothetical protein